MVTIYDWLLFMQEIFYVSKYITIFSLLYNFSEKRHSECWMVNLTAPSYADRRVNSRLSVELSTLIPSTFSESIPKSV